MKTSNTVLTIVAVIIIVFGGWYLFSMSSTQNEAATPTDSLGLNDSQNQTDAEVKILPPALKVYTDPKLGTILVASNGMTLYKYKQDKANVSNCSGECAINWPPFSPLANEPLVSSSSMTGQLDTITRTDGIKQLTYKGVPLYYYIKDTKPGDTTGQNVGGVWFVVKP